MWCRVDNDAAVAIVTERFITCWESSDVKRQPWSRDLCNIMDTTQGLVIYIAYSKMSD